MGRRRLSLSRLAGPLAELRRRAARFRDRRGRPFPAAMQLEVTNRCNLRCRMCPSHGGARPPRSIGLMPVEGASRLVREFAAGGGRLLIPHGAGEPLLHPHLLEIVGLARRLGLEVAFDSNGLLLDPETAGELVRLGSGAVGISIDAADPAGYLAVTGTDALARVEANARNLAEERRRQRADRPLVRVLMVALPENEAGRPEFVRRSLDWADEVVVQTERIGAGRQLAEPPPAGERRAACVHLFRTLFVQWDGKVPICCEDWQGDSLFGNVFDAGIGGLWRGERLSALRQAHLAGEFAAERLCADCQAWVDRPARRSRRDGLLLTATPLTRTYERLVPCP